MSVALMSHRAALKRFPGGWSPKELSTLSLWLDADDPTTITLATGVSQWNDKSGNGYNVSQATGGNQPTWARSVQNGRGAVTFASASSQGLIGTDVMDMLAGSVSAAGAFTVSTHNGIVTKIEGTVDTNGEWSFTSDNLIAYLGGALRGAQDTAAPADGTWRLMASVLNRSASVTTWRNGTQSATSTTGFPNTTSYNVSASIAVGQRSDNRNYFNGKVGELVVSLAVWSTTDRQKVEGYLAHKWGTTSSLPADHPYKSVAP